MTEFDALMFVRLIQLDRLSVWTDSERHEYTNLIVKLTNKEKFYTGTELLQYARFGTWTDYLPVWHPWRFHSVPLDPNWEGAQPGWEIGSGVR